MARWWIDNDPDPAYAATLRSLLDAGDSSGLAAAFEPPLRFGTAGVRGPLGPGAAGLNRMVVRLATLGLIEWAGDTPAVVVARDARHRSDDFSSEVADVVSASGGTAIVLDVPVPTPVLAWAVPHLDADAGVMVTASHNPPADNGYKTYGPRGAQLLPPDAAVIEASMDSHTGGDVAIAPRFDRVERCDDSIIDSYLDALIRPDLCDGIGGLTAAYTAMHGVGGETTRRLADRIGFALEPVAEQYEPDPDFPTVAFPNPEEPGATDLLLSHAAAVDADVALAHDPDADRLAVAIVDGGIWRQLSGNELGVLLGDHLIRRSSGDRIVSTTVVSSSALGAIAEAHGVECVRTLTGSKWVVRPGLDRDDARFVFGYEEALGYAVNDVVHEKDGVGAAMETLDLVATLRSEGSDPIARLDALAHEHGRFGEAQRILMIDDPEQFDRVRRGVADLRARSSTTVGERVASVVDFADGRDGLPPADMVEVDVDGGGRVLIRPSGTEPKLKIYAESRLPGSAGREEANAAAGAIADGVVETLQTSGR